LLRAADHEHAISFVCFVRNFPNASHSKELAVGNFRYFPLIYQRLASDGGFEQYRRRTIGRSLTKNFSFRRPARWKAAPRQNLPRPNRSPGAALSRARQAYCFMARLVTEKEAADYIGLELATFRAWVASGRLPEPIADCGKYDSKALDLALDRISGINGPARSQYRQAAGAVASVTPPITARHPPSARVVGVSRPLRRQTIQLDCLNIPSPVSSRARTIRDRDR
jgi:hypothetical protein